MHPDKASAAMIAVIENRNARATRTGAIPESETVLVLHRLWLTKRFLGAVRTRAARPAAPSKPAIRRPHQRRSGTTRRCRPARNSRPDSWRDIADDSLRQNRIRLMARSRL